MKETVCRGGVDIIGHTEYTGVLPGRSCVDAVTSIDAMDLHRLFSKEEEFALADGDPLILSFADYTWIVTFLGEANSDFEQNLIFTANCSHSAEVMMLEMKPKEVASRHISDFYREQFVSQSGFDPFDKLKAGKLTASGLSASGHKQTVSPCQLPAGTGKPLIRSTQADRNKGREILDEAGVSQTLKPIIIHPGSGGVQKCWYLDNFLAIASMLAKRGLEAVFVLGPAEQERFGKATTAKIGEVARTLSNLPLTDVLAVLSSARGYIGNDSGITHLASALGLPTIAVFGPTEPGVYGPVGPAVTVLQSRESNFAEAVSKDLQQEAVDKLLA
jgi:hypothetical protein